MNFGLMSTSGACKDIVVMIYLLKDLSPASGNSSQLTLLSQNPGDGGVVGVLSWGDSLQSQNSVQVGLMLVPSREGLKHTGSVGRSNSLVLADHQQLGRSVLLGHSQGTSSKKSKADGGAEHFESGAVNPTRGIYYNSPC